MSDIKQNLLQQCINYVQQRLNSINAAINMAQQSAAEDTKSSAGDKYETGREMLQQETNRNMGLLAEANKLMVILNRIPTSGTQGVVGPGSLVITNNGKFYIAISAGALTVNAETYFAVSQASPVGLKLMGCKPGDTFSLNGKTYQIAEVL